VRDVLIIAWREFSVRVFRWTFWLVALGVPVLALLMALGLAAGERGDLRTVAVVDSAGELDGALVDYFEESALIRIERGEPEPERVGEEISGVLRLGRETRSEGSAVVQGARPLPTAHARALEEAVQYVLIDEALASSGVSGDVLLGVQVEFEDLQGQVDETDLEMRVGAVIGATGLMILWMVLAGQPLQVVLSVLEEKESGLVEALLGITSARALLMGKILGLGGVAVVQGCLWGSPFLVLSVLATSEGIDDPEALEFFGALPGPDVAVVFGVALVLGYLSFTLIAAVVASLLPSKQHADGANMVLMVLSFVPIAVGLPATNNPMALSARVFGLIPPSPLSCPSRDTHRGDRWGRLCWALGSRRCSWWGCYGWRTGYSWRRRWVPGSQSGAGGGPRLLPRGGGRGMS